MTHTTTIVALSTVCTVLLLMFAVFRRAAGGRYLDEVVSRSKSQGLVDQLTPSQVRAHIWVTSVLDTMFPACYGLWLTSITLRLAGAERTWLIIPAVLAVTADYLENWSQMTALRTNRVPCTKPIFSASKWMFLGLAITIASLAWLFLRSAA